MSQKPENPPSLSSEEALLADANMILGKGFLMHTRTGLICMTVNDALSTDMNILQQGDRHIVVQHVHNKVPNLRMACDSDGGFSSECSDSTCTTTASSSTYPSFTKVSSIPDEISLNSNLGRDKSSEESDSTRGSISVLNSDGCLSPHQVLVKKKGRGGWPKGRKRKPELLNLPPKAPATGYNLYLNEQRGFFKESSLPFYEITKIVGNRWSSLTLEQKKPYLNRAEEDKKRYREELKQYRHSEAYRAYLNKKRRNRLQNNVLSESDMDATDDFDEEDNEELYCRTCDQWFHNLHNKREHLQAKKHLTSLAGDIHRELSDVESTITNKTEGSMASNSLDESSLEGYSCNPNKNATITVYEAMSQVAMLNRKCELELKLLRNHQEESGEIHKALCQQLKQLTERESALQKDLDQKREQERVLECNVFQLWQIPSMFVMSSFDVPEDGTGSEGTS
ncbi:uncharacterized protein [Euwallacea similis]|uniref:uncharacterized protein n=1 Tax=Euwallacea similis TaxID=1736056 RepID=UPI00344EF797